MAFGGTSRYGTTCTKQLDGSWLVCSWYTWNSLAPEWLYYCYLADDPEPPPPPTPTGHVFSWCPDAGYDDQQTVKFTVVSETPCSCLDGVEVVASFDVSLGTEGGWYVDVETCDSPLSVSIYPMGEAPFGGMFWRIDLAGSGWGTNTITIAACGADVLLSGVNMFGEPCPGAQVNVLMQGLPQ